MAKPDVIGLAQLLAAGQADTAHLDRFYDETLEKLAAESEALSFFALVPVAGTPLFAYPDSAVRLLGVFWTTRELARTSASALGATLGANWRALVRNPVAFTEDGETRGAFRIVPVPARPAQAFIPVFFSPFGRDYPPDAIAVLCTERRTDVPRYLDLWLALAILAREYRRASVHQDEAFAAACSDLAARVWGMVG